LFYKDSSGVVQVLATKGGVNATSSGQVLFNNSGVVGGSNNLFWDSANTRLGIGTNSPQAPLSVSNSGAAGFEFIPTAPGGGTGTYIQSYNRSGGAYVDTYYYAASHTWRTSASSTSMVLDASGNVGIGTSSPTAGFRLQAVSAGGTNVIASTSSDASGATIYMQANTSTSGIFGTLTNHPLTFVTNNTEAGRFDNSGNLLVGTTTNSIGGGTGKTAILGSSTGYGLITAMPSNGGQYYYHAFGTSAGVQTGYIASTNGVTTSYVSLSDYRLKENVAPMINALATVAKLKPVTYKWKTDGSDGQGFIAHELQEIVPDCVTGEKDGVDKDGNPKYQGVDTSFLVATLVAAIQELKAEIDLLKRAK
jgi:hypothetical protein